MATSRGGMPADPTLTATTDDNARGGLFVRSNVGNIVQGVDVSSGAANDTTVTLEVTIDGQTQMANFTLDNPQDQNPTLTFTGIGGSGGGGNPVTGGMVDAAGDNIILTRENSTPITIPTGALINNTELTTRLAALSIPTTFHQLTDTPSEMELDGGDGMFLSVNADGNIVLVPRPTSSVALNSFESSDTVRFRAGTTDTNDISADARATWTGNTNRGGITGTVNISSLTLDASTGLILEAINATEGTYRLTTQGTAPAQGNAGVALTVPQTETAFTVPTPPSGTVNADPGSTITMVTGSITNEDMSVNVPASTMIDTSGDRATITFPASTTDRGARDYGNDGVYTVTTMTTVTTPETTDNPRTITTMETFNRFVPFYQVRRATTPTTLAHLQAGTESTAAYSNSVGFTANFPGTSGNFYFATTVLTDTGIDTADFGALNLRARVRHVGTVTGMDYGGDPLTYNVYQIAGVQNGQIYRNFRDQ